VLQDCISHVVNWCLSTRLQLYATKSELIWFGTRHFAEESNTENDLALHLDSGPVHAVSAIRDLGIMLDCELSMKQHNYMIKVVSSCFYYLPRLKQSRRLVGKEACLGVHSLSP